VARDVRAFAVAFVMLLGVSVSPQTGAPTQQLSRGTVERFRIHARSLENNLLGDSPDRYVSVYLPPSYLASGTRRYPVVYLLHGFDDDDDHWFGRTAHFIDLPKILDGAAAAATAREAIRITAVQRGDGTLGSAVAITDRGRTACTE
jgi:hypothetical protein